jgi:hypothetical protein
MSIAALVVVTALFGPAADGKANKPVPEVTNDPPAAGKIDGPGPLDDARKVAEAYLNALAGKGGDDARNYLLGGLTLTAQDFSIPNWRIISRDEARVEEKPLADAVKMMWALDKAGASSLSGVVVVEGEPLALSQEQAEKLLLPTREMAHKFQERFPLFSYVSRNGKDVYWHPENPWRKEIKNLGTEGSYQLELHRFTIEERENGKQTRLWPLRALRIKTKSYNSGWKILPASDWDPNY